MPYINSLLPQAYSDSRGLLHSTSSMYGVHTSPGASYTPREASAVRYVVDQHELRFYRMSEPNIRTGVDTMADIKYMVHLMIFCFT
jgi:hypothetical protein